MARSTVNGANITADVASGGGYHFGVKVGKQKTFTTKIKAKLGIDGACLGPNIIDTGGDDHVLIAVNTAVSSC